MLQSISFSTCSYCYNFRCPFEKSRQFGDPKCSRSPNLQIFTNRIKQTVFPLTFCPTNTSRPDENGCAHGKALVPACACMIVASRLISQASGTRPRKVRAPCLSCTLVGTCACESTEGSGCLGQHAGFRPLSIHQTFEWSRSRLQVYLVSTSFVSYRNFQSHSLSVIDERFTQLHHMLKVEEANSL